MDSSAPITVCITRRVKPGSEAAFERALHEFVLTLCDGKVTYAASEFSGLDPALPPVSPDWSPVGHYGGYDNSPSSAHSHTPVFGADGRLWEMGCGCAV